MNGFCSENYLNLLKHDLYGEYINEYLTFYAASFNYTKQAAVSGRPFFYLFWVYSSAFAFMRATRFSVSGCEENNCRNLEDFGASSDNFNNLFSALYMAYGSMLFLMQNSKP